MRHGIVVMLSLVCVLIAVPAHAEFATYYGGERHHNYCGRPTASGEIYNCNAMTAAMLKVPLGSSVHVCGPAGCATLRINDRGPYANGASIDLSMAAARVICGGLRSCHVSISRGSGRSTSRNFLRKGSWGL